MNGGLKLFAYNLFSGIFDRLSCMIVHRTLVKASFLTLKEVIYLQLLYHRNDANSIYRKVPSSYPLVYYRDHPDLSLKQQPANQQQVNIFQVLILF